MKSLLPLFKAAVVVGLFEGIHIARWDVLMGEWTSTNVLEALATVGWVAGLHIGVWMLLGVFLVVAAALAVKGQTLPALVSLALAAGAGIAALVQRSGGETERRTVAQTLGKAPYAVFKVLADLAFVQRLEGIIQELRDAGQRNRK